ncbi:uncharacterized protein si:ch211-196f2.6 isoform X1 [Esox lucius]|uniref:uncharacterized protein si:ch211-196f2.6 isoform X1 n=1 Tax=Esox lucius TaxID=8010 RepID=UPI001476CEBA|nr:uncharacterized protein si:ch211-196f2.6 isoform X1 [Esox lucius]
MRKRCVGTLLILALLQTGIVNCRISVYRVRDGDRLSITCRIVEKNNNVTQINWEMIKSLNHTTTRVKLGTFHPEYGIHLAREYNKTVKIQGDVFDHSSTVHLTGDAMYEDSQFCCIFHTFPAGRLEKCADRGEWVEAQESEDVHENRPVVQWALLVGGCTICFFSVSLSLYFCWKYCCRHCCGRRRVFKVETCLTDQHTDTERITEEQPHHAPLPPPPVTQPQGFDPSKLYAKIKLDLLYGRLWKAYNGATRAWGSSTQQDPQHQRSKQGEGPGPQKVYSLLGEHRGSQIKEPEEPVLKLEPQSATDLEHHMEAEAEQQPTQEGSEKPTHETDPFPMHAPDPGTQ